LTLAGTLSGSGPLTKIGDGTLNLTGPISYTGNVSIASGLVRINNGTTSTLGTVTGAGSLTVASGSTLTVTSLRVGSLAPAAASAVPEPGTLVLLALAGLGMLLAWRRK
jgi:autotransporter-associated beta strand protein